MVIKEIVIELIKKSRFGCISENIVIELSDYYKLSNYEFSMLCDELLLKEISIVSDDEYNQYLS